MLPINYTVIVVATIAALLFSALYYFVLRKKITTVRQQYLDYGAEARPSLSFNKVIVEITRTFIVSLAMAYAVVNAMNLVQAAVVVVWLWVAFPVVLYIGLVIHDRFPASLAVIHAFDWLMKLLIIACILTLWR